MTDFEIKPPNDPDAANYSMGKSALLKILQNVQGQQPLPQIPQDWLNGLAFQEFCERKGVRCERVPEQISKIQPLQPIRQWDQVWRKFKQGPGGKPLLVCDNGSQLVLLDGHHSWAAMYILNFIQQKKGSSPLTFPMFVIESPLATAIAVCSEFAQVIQGHLAPKLVKQRQEEENRFANVEQLFLSPPQEDGLFDSEETVHQKTNRSDPIVIRRKTALNTRPLIYKPIQESYITWLFLQS